MIESQLLRLEKLIETNGDCTFFNPPAQESTIDDFEKVFHVELPLSHKKFLLKYNGGTCLYQFKEEINSTSNYRYFLGEAVYFFSIEEIWEKYNYRKNRSWKFFEELNPYPIIPFCQCPNGELLVFVHGEKSGNNSPVFDAFHEEPASEWGILEPDFSSFLRTYIDTKGSPNLIGDYDNGVAKDYFNKNNREETPEEILVRTEIQLKKELRNNFETDTNVAFLYAEQAWSYFDLNQLKKAREAVNNAIKHDSDNANYYYLRSCISEKEKATDKVLNDLEKAVELEPSNSFYLSLKAQILFDMKKVDQALIACNRAIDLDAKNELAYMTRFQIYKSLGETEKANTDSDIITDLLMDG